MDANISNADLLTRMRALEDEIVSRNTAGSSSSADYAATYGPRKIVVPPVPPPPQTFDTDTAAITHVNLVGGFIGTTLGEFPLDEKEIAQIAYIGVQAVSRNLQAMLLKMGQDHGVPKLQAEIDRQQNEIAKMVRESRHSQANGVAPETKAAIDTIVREGESSGDARDDFGNDDFDENGPTPIPLNKPRTRRGRPAKA